MLNITELETKIREASDKAHEEYMTVAEAYIATNCSDEDLRLKDKIATEMCLALGDALMLVEIISWNSDKTEDEVAKKIVDSITCRVNHFVNALLEGDCNTKEQAA